MPLVCELPRMANAKEIALKLKFSEVPHIQQFEGYDIITPVKGIFSYLYKGTIQIYSFEKGLWTIIPLTSGKYLFIHEIATYNRLIQGVNVLSVPNTIIYEPSRYVEPVFIYTSDYLTTAGINYPVANMLQSDHAYIFQIEDNQNYMVFVRGPNGCNRSELKITTDIPINEVSNIMMFAQVKEPSHYGSSSFFDIFA